MDGFDRQLVVDELDDEAHDGGGTVVGDPRRAALVAVGAGGLEPVVTVGEDERRTADDGLDGGDALRVVDRAERVARTVAVLAAAEEFGRARAGR